MITVHLRLYEELNDYLPAALRKRRFVHRVEEGTTVGEVVDGLSLPRGEVDLVLADDVSVGFDHRVREGERISLYPVFESLDIAPATRLPDRPLRRSSFVLDVHLGRLSKYLRLLGFDTLYRNDFDDDELTAVSERESRILLSRDQALVRRRDVTRAYLVTATEPRAQVVEVVKRFDLDGRAQPFRRCLACNGVLQEVDKAAVQDRLPPHVRTGHRLFRHCPGCHRLYWRGSHWQRMNRLVEEILREAAD